MTQKIYFFCSDATQKLSFTALINRLPKAVDAVLHETLDLGLILPEAQNSEILVFISDGFDIQKITRHRDFRPDLAKYVLFCQEISQTNMNLFLKSPCQGFVSIDEVAELSQKFLEKKLDINSLISNRALSMLLDYLRVSEHSEKFLLSSRESQVLELISQGVQYAEIGHILGLTEKTVAHYSINAQKKLNAKTLPHAISLFLKSTKPLN